MSTFDQAESRFLWFVLLPLSLTAHLFSFHSVDAICDNSSCTKISAHISVHPDVVCSREIKYIPVATLAVFAQYKLYLGPVITTSLKFLLCNPRILDLCVQNFSIYKRHIGDHCLGHVPAPPQRLSWAPVATCNVMF